MCGCEKKLEFGVGEETGGALQPPLRSNYTASHTERVCVNSHPVDHTRRSGVRVYQNESVDK